MCLFRRGNSELRAFPPPVILAPLWRWVDEDEDDCEDEGDSDSVSDGDEGMIVRVNLNTTSVLISVSPSFSHLFGCGQPANVPVIIVGPQ